LVYPILALNKAGLDGFRRCPRLIFDTSEAEDLALYADGLPKLVSIGMKIPSRYAHDKLKIPQPENGEEILTANSQNQDLPNFQNELNHPALPVNPLNRVQNTAAATMTGSPLRTASHSFTPQQQEVEAIADNLLIQNLNPIDPNLIYAACQAATTPEDLEQRLAMLMAGVEPSQFAKTLEQALFTADCLGYLHAS
jgi:phage gp29-like protein